MDGGGNMITPDSGFRDAVTQGLSKPQKSISPKWLYDARGSALFEDITTLPEYYPSRVETSILAENAADIAALVAPGGVLVELGAGASTKTRLILDYGRHFQAYAPMDISEAFLVETAVKLRDTYPKMRIVPIIGDFLGEIAFPKLLQHVPKVGFFPGSTIGNVSHAQAVTLLRHARQWPRVGHFVLGFDLIKDAERLRAAYDDAQGVTAAFIKNVLYRIQSELNGGLNPDAFSYQCHWNEDDAQIEMSVVSQERQQIAIGPDKFQFEAGEALHISTSRKFDPEKIDALAAQSGWRLEKLITDDAAQFAVAILKA